MYISVVIPVYGCRAALKELYRRLTDTLIKITEDYEIILVDDCCPQNSWEDIEKICKEDKKVVGIHLSRNFGQQKAITAGLDNSKGEWIVVMDCDLQDRPENILALYDKAQEGYDIVLTKRKDRKDSRMTKFLSKSFYRVYNYFAEDNYDPDINNFSIASRKVVDYFCRMREQNRDYIFFIRWLGFKEATIELEEDARFEGKSSYNLNKKLKLAFETITAQSNKPLHFSIRFGFVVALISFIFIIYLIIRHFAINDLDIGWPSVIASVFLMGGLLLCAVGIAGLYIGNIFNEAKNRPLYAISEILNEQIETNITKINK